MTRGKWIMALFSAFAAKAAAQATGKLAEGDISLPKHKPANGECPACHTMTPPVASERAWNVGFHNHPVEMDSTYYLASYGVRCSWCSNSFYMDTVKPEDK